MPLKIHTTNGKSTIVDEQDFVRFRSRGWHAKYNERGRLVYRVIIEKGKRKMSILYRELLDLKDCLGVEVHKKEFELQIP